MAAVAFAFVLAVPWHPARAADAAVVFDAANKLYEQGKFSEAAETYEQLIKSGQRSANAYFNLGTAAFKAGQLGRAIAAYRLAERMTPRDASLRANLQFARTKVSEESRVEWWATVARLLTLNEWAAAAALAYWAFFALIGIGEAVPSARRPKTAVALAFLTLLCGGGLWASVWEQIAPREAVVAAKQAIVRFGPLEESQVAFQVPDGTELCVLDAKGEWLQVRNDARAGWVRRDQIIVLASAFTAQSL